MNSMDAAYITKQLFTCYAAAKYKAKNVYFFGAGYGETDVLIISQSDYIYDIEIKISRSDFKADFKKEVKHRNLCNNFQTDCSPNKFYYCVPEGLISVEEVPDYAGLLTVNQYGLIKEVKKAPFLHKNKIPYERNLLTKYYYGYLEAISLKSDSKVKSLESRIKILESQNELLKKNQNQFYENQLDYSRHRKEFYSIH